MHRPKGAKTAKKPLRNALSQSVRSRALCACCERETTPKEFALRERLDASRAGYQFRRLERERSIRVSRTQTARGVQRKFYVATRRKLVSDTEFDQMAFLERGLFSETTLLCLLHRFERAWRAATIAPEVSYVSSPTVLLDDEGFREVSAWLEATLEFLQELQDKSLDRLQQTGGRRIFATAALAGFESPPKDAPAEHLARLLSGTEDLTRMGAADGPGPLGPARKVIDALRRCKDALWAGTLDSRSDSHLSWLPLLLDGAGFCELVDRLARTRAFALDAQARSLTRLRESNETPTLTTVGLIGFESPPESAPGKGEDDEAH